MLDNKKTYVAFKKGFNDRGFDGWLGFLIMLRTLGLQSHVELRLSDKYDNLSFSSDMDIGVRFKDIKYSHPERWTFIEWDPLNNIYGPSYEKEHDLYLECKSIEGLKYDMYGVIVDELIPLRMQNDNEYWCSEAISHVMKIADTSVSPVKLYRYMRKKEKDYESNA